MHGNPSHSSPESWTRLNKITARTIGNSRPSTKLQSISDISWRVERLKWSLITSRLFMPLYSARKKLPPASNVNWHWACTRTRKRRCFGTITGWPHYGRRPGKQAWSPSCAPRVASGTNYIADANLALQFQGRQFESNLAQSLLKLLGCHRVRTTPYHPSSNGMIKRFHRALKAAIMCHATREWTRALPIPVEHQGNRKIFVFKELSTCSHVFLRVGAARKSLNPSYSGTHKVLNRITDRIIEIDVNGGAKRVSLENIKPAHMLRNLEIQAPQDFQPEDLPLHENPPNNSESQCVPNVIKDVTISQPRSCSQRHIPNILRKSVAKNLTFKFWFYNVW